MPGGGRVVFKVTCGDLSFGGSMRDISVSFAKTWQALEFRPQRDVEQGSIELRYTIESGLVKSGTDSRHRNARFIVQRQG